MSFRALYRTVDSPSELNLHRTAHLALAGGQHEVEGFGQRIRMVFEYIVECDHSSSLAGIVVAKHVVAVVVDRGHPPQSSCRSDVLY